MAKLDNKSIELLETLIDHLETEYGDIEGFEVRLEHIIEGGASLGKIKRFIVHYLHKSEFEV
jgi:hypothetical protein